MFVGHAALAFAAKRKEPRASLAELLVATYALDLLWPVLVLLGVERVRIAPGVTAFTPLDFEWYPWSHSLLMAVVWGIAGAGIVYAVRRRAGAALIVGALVVSHWVLDFVVHRPDLPLGPGRGSPLVGLGLWNSIPGTLIVEGAMFVAGVALYLGGSHARDRIGSVALYSLLALLTLAWVSGPFSAPPPSAGAVAWVGLAFGILVIPWAVWIERHRGATGATGA
jgi:hypothetical protein